MESKDGVRGGRGGEDRVKRWSQEAGLAGWGGEDGVGYMKIPPIKKAIAVVNVRSLLAI